jgi:SAM-dependent methyltransferase
LVTIPTFAQRRKAWSSPPVDDIGYIPAKEMRAMDDDEFADLMQRFWHNRYEGWRNHEGRWVNLFEMHEGGISGKRVLDYGCGVGMEGAQYANLGNRVWLADIAPENLEVARRLFGLYGLRPQAEMLVGPKFPLPVPSEPMDVIHCVGVLHHIPEPEPVVAAMHSWLTAGGRLHLMVYSHRAWKVATGTTQPEGRVEDHPMFERFWQHWDPIGGYADWYDAAKLERRFGQWFRIKRTEKLTAGGEYLGAVLEKR